MLLALILAIVVLDSSSSLAGDLLTVLPIVGFGLLMVVRPYFGAGTIARLRRGAPRKRRLATPDGAPFRSRREIARGGRLIASALAGRAPPLLGAR